MGEMIDRVAGAIQVAVMLTHDEAKDAASAAIKAMREPTFYMEKVGGQAMDHVSTDDVVDAWERMIDAALE